MKLATFLADALRVALRPRVVRRWLALGAVFVFSFANTSVLLADERLPNDASPSDSSAMCHLFGEETLAENHAELMSRARGASKQRAYELLSDWVLPGQGHGFRVAGQIGRNGIRRAAAGLPASLRMPEFSPPEVTGRVLPNLADYPESQWILSPLRELIKLAEEVGRLQELRQRVVDHDPSSPIEAARKATVLTLTDIAAGQVDEVAEHLEERFTSLRERDAPGTSEQYWLDLLVLWAVGENHHTAHLLTEDTFGVYSDWSNSEDTQLDAVLDYLKLLHGRCQSFEFTDRIQPAENADLDGWERQWMWFSRSDASTHARGRPLTRFVARPAGIFKASGHEMDYLLYRTPIAGPLDVHCEFGTQASASTEMMLHGTSVFPSEDGRLALIGGFAKTNQPVEVVPTLEGRSRVSESQVVVRDGQVAYSFNGRELHRRAVGEPAAPWLGLRSWRRTDSGIRSVQINGAKTPTTSIPLLGDETHRSTGPMTDVVDFAKDPDARGSLARSTTTVALRGWTSYYHSDSGSGLGAWNLSVDANGAVSLVQDRSDGPAGSFDESLLRYAIPIRWDAEISYEFFFRDGEELVHPSFGRRVFLLDSSSVAIHDLTDGRHERSDLRPDNSHRPQDASVANNNRPMLKEGWNSAILRVQGQQLVILINGRQALKIQIAKSDSRLFGLFHYRDQTAARVRKIQLRSDWRDRKPPPIDAQVLAPELALQLDRSASDLPIAFAHDFREGLPTQWFAIAGDEGMISQQEDGVRVTRVSGGGVDTVAVSAMFDGDFDITANYKNLDLPTGDVVWHCGFGLAINLENLTRDRFAINRRRDRMHGQQSVGVGRKEVTAGGKFKWTGGWGIVGESVSGCLRLARRGNTLYALHKTGEGSTFRLIYQSDFPAGPIAANGLKLVSDVAKGQQVAITWTDLTVRAEHVDLLNVKDNETAVNRLNERRQKLSGETIDFAKTSFDDAGLAVSSSLGNEIASNGYGVSTTVRGASRQGRLTIGKPVFLNPEFDIQVDFQILQMDADRQGKVGGEHALQVLFESQGEPAEQSGPNSLRVTEATLILRRRSETTIDLRPRVVGRGRADKTVFLPLRTLFIKSIDQLRIAQQNNTLYFLASTSDRDESQVITTYSLAEPLSPTTFSCWTIGSPNGGVTKTDWKQLRLHGIRSPDQF